MRGAINCVYTPAMKPAAALLLVALAAPVSLQAVARRFLVNFATGRRDAAAADFNEQMKETVTPAILASKKQEFDRDFGRFQAITAVQDGTDGGFPLVTLTARFEKASALVQVTFDNDGRIGAIRFDRVPDHNPQLERVARDVFDAFNGRRFEQIGKYFDEKMRAQLPPAALESLYNDVTGVYGKFKSLTEVKYATERDLRIVNIFADYEKQPMLFEIVFNPGGRVVGWSFRPH